NRRDIPFTERLASCRTIITHTPFQQDSRVAAAILERYRKVLGSRLSAVRSSHAMEDAHDKSHAGLYDTELGTPPERVLEAIKKVWASALTEQAFIYTDHDVMLSTDYLVQMSVVVQVAIDAEAAGVLFTRDPIHPESGLALVRATYGLGKAVVDG